MTREKKHTDFETASHATRHAPQFLTFAHQLADVAGAAIRPYFGAHGDVETKGDHSPVTVADREAETAMRALIEKHYPEHAIYGEEFGQSGDACAPLPTGEVGFSSGPISDTTTSTMKTACLGNPGEGAFEQADSRPHPDLQPNAQERLGKSDLSRGRGVPVAPPVPHYTWVLDPIDGTRAFIAGRKEWGTLISLCQNGVPILGILDQPITGERWVGVKGAPTLYNGTPAKTRACASLTDAELSTTSTSYFTPEQAKHVVALAQACRSTVKDGDCYAYGLLARGMRDIVIDAGLKPYDILALVPIIEGAGGKITTWDGEAVTLANYASVIASGDKSLHSRALALLQGA